MADLGNTSVISPTDASNGSGTMPSWLGSAAPSTLDDAGRALQGATAREWECRSYPTSTGTAPAFVVTMTVAPAALRSGQTYTFTAHAAAVGTDTLNPNTLGAKGVKKIVAGVKTATAANDWYIGDKIAVTYDGTDMVWVNKSGSTPSGSITASGYTQTTARLLGRTTASTGAIEEITVGSGLTLSAGSLTGSGATVDTQTVTATGAGTWTKPSGGQKMAMVEIWAAGGSGGKGRATSAAGGGGGGQYVRKFFALSALGATEALSIGTGGAAQTVADSNGNVGGNTTFGTAGTLVTAYGGGPGMGTDTTGINGGGHGGGPNSAGGTNAGQMNATYGVANFYIGTANEGTGGRAGVGVATGESGRSTLHNGAGGGGSSAGADTVATGAGGDSLYGGAGGGAGAEDASPGPSAGGGSQFGGSGGAGAFDANAATAGTQPAGGGGGSETGTSGAGGNGKVVVTSW